MLVNVCDCRKSQRYECVGVVVVFVGVVSVCECFRALATTSASTAASTDTEGECWLL